MADEGTAHRMGSYAPTGSTLVVVKLADVPAGLYGLEVRTRPTDKDVWVGIASDPFTVVE